MTDTSNPTHEKIKAGSTLVAAAEMAADGFERVPKGFRVLIGIALAAIIIAGVSGGIVSGTVLGGALALRTVIGVLSGLTVYRGSVAYFGDNTTGHIIGGLAGGITAFFGARVLGGYALDALSSMGTGGMLSQVADVHAPGAAALVADRPTGAGALIGQPTGASAAACEMIGVNKVLTDGAGHYYINDGGVMKVVIKAADGSFDITTKIADCDVSALTPVPCETIPPPPVPATTEPVTAKLPPKEVHHPKLVYKELPRVVPPPVEVPPEPTPVPVPPPEPTPEVVTQTDTCPPDTFKGTIDVNSEGHTYHQAEFHGETLAQAKDKLEAYMLAHPPGRATEYILTVDTNCDGIPDNIRCVYFKADGTLDTTHFGTIDGYRTFFSKMGGLVGDTRDYDSLSDGAQAKIWKEDMFSGVSRVELRGAVNGVFELIYQPTTDALDSAAAVNFDAIQNLNVPDGYWVWSTPEQLKFLIDQGMTEQQASRFLSILKQLPASPKNGEDFGELLARGLKMKMAFMK